MARIGKADHSRILHMVDVEQRKVAEVAAEFGCTSANIYALLSKLRRTGTPAPWVAIPEVVSVAPVTPPPDLFAAVAVDELGAGQAETETAEPVMVEAAADASVLPPSGEFVPPSVEEPAQVRADEPPALARPEEPAAPAPVAPASATISELPRRPPAANRNGVGAKLAKSGYGLVMRAPEGDENMTPFRSLDDLLSAVKPILRAAVRSPEPVWFCIQPIDLATVESDVA